MSYQKTSGGGESRGGMYQGRERAVWGLVSRGMRIAQSLLALAVLCLGLGVEQAQGDGEAYPSAVSGATSGRLERDEGSKKRAGTPLESNILPGEAVVTEDGEKMKVWSTHGSPSEAGASVPPSAPAAPGLAATAPIANGVIVDLRGEPRRSTR